VCLAEVLQLDSCQLRRQIVQCDTLIFPSSASTSPSVLRQQTCFEQQATMFPQPRSFALLAPAIALLLVCVFIWEGWSRGGLPPRFSSSSGAAVHPTLPSFIFTPDVKLSEDPSQLLDIQNATLGVIVLSNLVFPSYLENMLTKSLLAYSFKRYMLYQCQVVPTKGMPLHSQHT
jgi:hypothetical protein